MFLDLTNIDLTAFSDLTMYIEGFLKGDFVKYKGRHKLNQQHTIC